MPISVMWILNSESTWAFEDNRTILGKSPTFPGERRDRKKKKVEKAVSLEKGIEMALAVARRSPIDEGKPLVTSK